MMLTNERLTEIAKKRQALKEMLGQPALTESLMRELTDVALDLSIADIPHLLAHADTLAALLGRLKQHEVILKDALALSAAQMMENGVAGRDIGGAMEALADAIEAARKMGTAP